METSLLVTFIVLCSTVHFWKSAADISAVVQQVRTNLQSLRSPEDEASKRTSEAMDQVRQEGFRLACRFLRQANFANIIATPFIHNGPTCAIMMFLAVVAYAINSCIAEGAVRTSKVRVRQIFAFYYIVGLWSTWYNPKPTYDKLRIVWQVAALVCYVDTACHAPWQLALSLAAICSQLNIHGREFHVVEFALGESCLAMLLVIISSTLERTMKQRLASQLNAESLVAGFRRILSGVCDGEVQLDEQLRILEGSSGLNHILCCSDNLQGTLFQDLLVLQDEEDLRNFKQFFVRNEETRGAEMPYADCLRMSFRSSATSRVGADVFHVAIPYLSEGGGSQHVLCFKLDPEAALPLPKPVPPATEPAPLPARRTYSGGSGRSAGF